MSAVEVKCLPGRGRGLVTTRHVEAGEIIIAEEPLLLTVSQEAKDHACAHCMCWLENCTGAVNCAACQQVAFCSPGCQQQAALKPWVHAEATCRAYSHLAQLFPNDLESQSSLRFLIQAAALKHASSSSSSGGGGYAALLSLAGEATAASLAQAEVLQPALCKAVGDASGSVLSVAESAALLVKEQLNSYGLLAPLQHQAADGSSRAIRGGAVYPHCALINHECLPNVARFDALDAAVSQQWPAQWPGRPDPAGRITPHPPPLQGQHQPHSSSSSGGGGGVPCSSTAVVMRTLHALPPGTEVTQSYFPLHWSLQDRQQQAQQVYGFTCTCPRCLLESTPEWQQQQEEDEGGSSGEWETDEEGDAAGSSDYDMEDAEQQQQQHIAAAAAVAPTQQQQGVAGSSSGGGQQQQQQQQEPLDPTYLSLFMLKYMCSRDGCHGTMAAVQGCDACECSVCGAVRTDAQFMAELQA